MRKDVAVHNPINEQLRALAGGDKVDVLAYNYLGSTIVNGNQLGGVLGEVLYQKVADEKPVVFGDRRSWKAGYGNEIPLGRGLSIVPASLELAADRQTDDNFARVVNSNLPNLPIFWSEDRANGSVTSEVVNAQSQVLAGMMVRSMEVALREQSLTWGYITDPQAMDFYQLGGRVNFFLSARESVAPKEYRDGKYGQTPVGQLADHPVGQILDTMNIPKYYSWKSTEPGDTLVVSVGTKGRVFGAYVGAFASPSGKTPLTHLRDITAMEWDRMLVKMARQTVDEEVGKMHVAVDQIARYLAYLHRGIKIEGTGNLYPYFVEKLGVWTAVLANFMSYFIGTNEE